MKWYRFEYACIAMLLLSGATARAASVEGSATDRAGGIRCDTACCCPGAERSAFSTEDRPPCFSRSEMRLPGEVASFRTLPPLTVQQGLSATAPLPKRRLDGRVHRSRTSWDRLIPTHFKGQYAGSIGVVAFGFGWDYGPRCQWETDLMVGVLPAYNSDDPKMTLTLRQNWIPCSIRCNDRFAIEPFMCGIFLSTILSNKFWVREPDRYPKGYYSFSTRVRTHVFIGQRVVWNTSLRRERSVKSVTAYYELNTADIYLISRFTDRTLHTADILSLSFGVKLQFF